MKKTIVAGLIAGTFLICCKEKTGNTKTETKVSQKISKRNFSVNKQNACNDFFFDSILLVNYTANRHLPDSIARRMTSFYNSRNYEFAWFSSTGISEQARGFWNMYKYYSSYEPAKTIKDARFFSSMDSLMASTDSVWQDKQSKLTGSELQLTEFYLRFFLSNINKGYVKRKEIEKFIAAIKRDPIEIADSLVNKKHKDDKYYADANQSYGALQNYLSKYVTVYKGGGWPMISTKTSLLKHGQHNPSIAMLKKRLFLSGDFTSTDSSELWTDSLSMAVKKFQYRHGYKATGVLTEAQLTEINIPLINRIEQLLVNMTRMQWIIDQPGGRYIEVNIPEFLLKASENGKKIFDMPVVVGMEGHNTMLFTGRLNQVVFAPYWNIPESIIENEIVPAMKKDHKYLAKHNMEVTGTLRKGLPAIRQLPGPSNSLGLVKFLFPNSYDIYFHDTPAKSLFIKERRAFSHGCIRLSEPAKMAEWLLKDDPTWNDDLIQKSMHDNKEKNVVVKNAVPVMICYYTAWVDEDGLLRFATDIYGHDKAATQKIFVRHNTN